MKNARWLFLALFIVTLLAFKLFQGGSIRGTIVPSNAALSVTATSATDSVQGNVNLGGFEITNIKEGTYTVVIIAKPPYKSYRQTGVAVTKGGTTDLGTINLQPSVKKPKNP